jgi:tetratricopeptide (TPR) repeat protein
MKPATNTTIPLEARPWIALFFFGLLAAYAPALGSGFIWDDDAYVTSNTMLTASDGWRRIWFSAHTQSQFFPLTFSTFRIEYALWGLHPAGYHLVNVLLHSLNALLVWLVLKKLAVPGAWIAAALFAFHPVQVESVAWITELKNVQCLFFSLLAMLAWLRFLEKPGFGWFCYTLTFALYLLALCSKTSACTLPAALWLAAWIQDGKFCRCRLALLAPFVLSGLLFGLISIWWESHLGNYREDVGQGLTWLQRLLLAGHALIFYAGKLAWPVNLTFSYPHWQLDVSHPVNFFWPAGCVAVAVVLWRYRIFFGRRGTAAVLYFAATLSPLIGFIPLYTFRYSYVADHYQYAASIGLLALAAAGLSRLPRWVNAGLIGALGILTWSQAAIYHDQKILWEDTLKKNPASWMAQNNLGLALQNTGDPKAAASHYAQAAAMKPDYAPARYNLGTTLFALHQTNAALARLQEALALAPQDFLAHFNYAVALEQVGQPDNAAAHYLESIRLRPDYLNARSNLGRLFGLQGKNDQALKQFQTALSFAPDNIETRNIIGTLLRAQGRVDEAIPQFEEVLRVNSNHALAQANLGACLLQKGKTDEAISHLQEAVQLDPANRAVQSMLMQALAARPQR